MNLGKQTGVDMAAIQLRGQLVHTGSCMGV